MLIETLQHVSLTYMIPDPSFHGHAHSPPTQCEHSQIHTVAGADVTVTPSDRDPVIRCDRDPVTVTPYSYAVARPTTPCLSPNPPRLPACHPIPHDSPVYHPIPRQLLFVSQPRTCLDAQRLLVRSAPAGPLALML
eukprot:364481-Chlamydomonas_euryale.AAC.13